MDLDVFPDVNKDDVVPTAREAFAAMPWLARVPAATLDRLAEQSVFHTVPAGSQLFEQAKIPTFALFLAGGSVELLGIRGKDETLIELVRAPDLLLPAAILTHQPYLARGRVLDEAHLVMVQAETFRRAVAEDHALCLAVLACQAAQFRRQMKQAKNVRLRSAEERVGCYLLALAAAAPPGEPVRLPMEKRLIASQLEMKRETFSRCLATVIEHGLRVDGDILTVTDSTAARHRFRLDPLIDGAEAIHPLDAIVLEEVRS